MRHLVTTVRLAAACGTCAPLLPAAPADGTRTTAAVDPVLEVESDLIRPDSTGCDFERPRAVADSLITPRRDFEDQWPRLLEDLPQTDD